MVPVDDARQTIEFDDCFIITPAFSWWSSDWHAEKGGRKCPDGFYYGSDNNQDQLDEPRLREMIAKLDLPEAREWAKENNG